MKISILVYLYVTIVRVYIIYAYVYNKAVTDEQVFIYVASFLCQLNVCMHNKFL